MAKKRGLDSVNAAAAAAAATAAADGRTGIELTRSRMRYRRFNRLGHVGMVRKWS